MFTGLVAEVGTVYAVETTSDELQLQLATALAGDLAVGDSLAVNGVCLTVTRLAPGYAWATAVAETLSRTGLGALAAGAKVNLEPALRLGDRMGGHLVQGHVDGRGTIAAIAKRGASWELTIATDGRTLRYVVEKGSIAVDGVSLTVAELMADRFRVAVIPHTYRATTLGLRAPGDPVHLEADVIAKYVERLLHPAPGGAATAEQSAPLTEAFLKRHGFA